MRNLYRQEIQIISTKMIKPDLDKACFQHEMAYGKSKRTELGKVLKHKSFKTASDSNCSGCQRGLPIFWIKIQKKVVLLRFQILNQL